MDAAAKIMLISNTSATEKSKAILANYKFAHNIIKCGSLNLDHEIKVRGDRIVREAK